MVDMLLVKSRYRRLLVVAVILTAAALLYTRMEWFWPHPYMTDGVLVFNAQNEVAVFLGAMFALVWLPVNVFVSRQVARTINQANLASVYTWIYGGATLASLVFISARQIPVVILSFVAISVCFAMLIASNVLVKTVEDSRGRTT